MTPSAYISTAWTPPSREPIDRYIEREVELGPDSGLPGRISFDQLPMQRYSLRQFQSREYPKVMVMVASQCTKTASLILYLAWKIKNSPTPTAWYTDDDKNAKNMSQTRLAPALQTCKALAGEWPKDRSRAKWSLYQMASMDLYVRGTNAKKQAEQIPVQTVLCDERRNYPLGRMNSIRNRYKSFRPFKEISASVAGLEKDEQTQSWLRGTRTFFHWVCLQCGHRQPFRFGRKPTVLFPEKREAGGIVWETSAITRPRENEWNRAAMMATVRYECENTDCKRHYFNWEKPRLIATMNESNDWGAVHTNPMPDGDTCSIHWNELYMPWEECSWPKIAWKFIEAHLALKVNRDIEPLKIFVQESDGCPWRELDGDKAEESDITNRCGEYSIGEEWPPNVKCGRILTVDVQNGYLVYVFRQHEIRTGDSRLIDCGRVPDYHDLRAYQIAHRIPDCAVGIDSGWGDRTRQQELYTACISHGRWRRGVDGKEFWDGWLPLLGDDAKEFKHSEDGEQFVTYHKLQTWDKNIGLAGGPKQLQRCSWCGDHYRDMLYRHLIPGIIPGWLVPKNIAVHMDGEYIRELMIEERVEIRDAEGKVIGFEWNDTKGRHDKGDCEVMQLVMTDVGGIGRQIKLKK